MGRRQLIRLALVLLLLVSLAANARDRLQSISTAGAQAVAGTIAYVRPNNHSGDEIRLIEANGSNDRHIWSVGKADPYDVEVITGLDWRPDAREIAFASDHEGGCSWFESDIYAIRPDGGNYRRVTNAPHCAALSGYPQGSVTVTVRNYNSGTSLHMVYVAGAPGPKSIMVAPGGSASITFTDVADFGANVVQPVVAINGYYRWVGPAYADVQPGQTIAAGTLEIYGSGFEGVGAYQPKWRSDGSQVGYLGDCAPIYGIAASPSAGEIGTPLLGEANELACAMDRGPTTATANQILYSTLASYDEDMGIFRATEGNNDPGLLLVPLSSYEAEHVIAIEWLPDGSGFLFVKNYVGLGYFADIFRYDFSSGTITQLTNFPEGEILGDLSISPDGESLVFERTETEDGPTDLWIMQRDGSNMRLLVRNAAHPSWSPAALPGPLPPQAYLPLIRH